MTSLPGREPLQWSPRFFFLCFARALAWTFLPVRYAPARYASPVFPSGAFFRGTAARAAQSSGDLSRLRDLARQGRLRADVRSTERPQTGLFPRSACAA